MTEAQKTINLFRIYEGGQRADWADEMIEDIEFVNNVQWEIDIASALEANNLRSGFIIKTTGPPKGSI